MVSGEQMGERGSGKGLVARTIARQGINHKNPRKEQQRIANCVEKTDLLAFHHLLS